MQKQHAYYVAFVFLCSSISLPLKAENPATLKSAFGQWFEMGAAIPGPELSDAEQRLLLNNFTNVTPENCLKPGAIEPEEGKFTFAAGDAFVAFAQAHGPQSQRTHVGLASTLSRLVLPGSGENRRRPVGSSTDA